MSSTNKTYLVTGANSGLGLDAARQLALRDDVGTVFMACRSKDKAEAAMQSLVTSSGVNADKLVFVPFDGSASKGEIEASLKSVLPAGQVLDGVVLNAGGIGHDTTGKPTGPNNVLPIVQINLAAHVHMINFLNDNGHFHTTKANKKSRVIFAGTEGSRGIDMIGMKSPVFTESTPEYFKGYMDGSAYANETYNAMDKAYPESKGIATLYMAAWAREHANVNVFTVSPGGTKGTSFASQEAMPYIMKLIFPIMMMIMTWMGKFHSVEVGAKRYVDAVTGEGPFAAGDAFAKSGAFVASTTGVTGPMADQATVFETAKQYADVAKQTAVYKAMNEFL